MKLHVGCGTIYLKDYINIDADPHYFTPEAPPEILEMNTTTMDQYYKRDFCKGSGKTVADVKALADKLPYDDLQTDELVLIHVLEHIPHYDLPKVLTEINRVLRLGGKFRVGVPDVKGTAELLVQAKTEKEEDWAIRLLHGTQRNQWSHHYCGYTERTLKELLLKYGFGWFEVLPNINFYPAIHLNAYKYEGV